MKILYVTTIGGTMSFFPDHFKMLLEQGHTVELACNTDNSPVRDNILQLGLTVHNIPFSRSPLSPDNLKAVRQLRQLVKEGNYDIVHCHTPNAAAVTRLVCRPFRKKGLKVFYTAHGFHFYKGAPTKNWLLYYPVEWLCAHWTDKLLTINQEDYQLAKRKMRAKEIVYVHGVGFNSGKFMNTDVDKRDVRFKLGLADDDIVLLSVGEVNANKNHEIILRAIAELQNPKLQYCIAGQGNKMDYLKALSENLQIERQVHLLGFRNDINALYHAADICCFPTIREGLGLAGLEGMASGLPLLVADNRGTRDYCVQNVNGLMCDATDSHAFCEALAYLVAHPDERSLMGERNCKEVQCFDTAYVLGEMRAVYGFNG